MKICVFTGTRADYGLLKPLISKIDNDKDLTLQLLVSGMHLSSEFGNTIQEIKNDGFKINEKIEILLSSDTDTGLLKSTGLGLISYADSLNRLQPDIAIVLGDRFEALAFAFSAFVKKIPLIHISGGEVTEGAIDDSIRHSITKFSHLHLVATKEYKRRVIQLGEEPWRVFNVGEIGLIGIKDNLLSREEFEKSINFKLSKKNILVTFHPETLSNDNQKNFREILKALSNLKNVNIIFTKSNADSGGRVINKMIDEFVKNHKNSIAFTSLGRKKYLSALQYVDIVLGNSSSGLVEVPSFKKATINIGDRQKGRIKAKSVIDVKAEQSEILDAINYVYSDEFQEKLKTVINPYEGDTSLEQILHIIKKVNKDKLLNKKFFDINFEV
jgi:GDP/UDP-N,N'-diacetylbacillosamine 2-epimerase (hydrolysing)